MRIPGPTDVMKLAGQGYQAAEGAMALLPRLIGIVGEVEQLMTRVTALVGRIEATDRHADAVIDRTEVVVGRAEKLVGRAECLIDRADAMAALAQGMLDPLAPLAERFQPSLDKLEPMVAHLAATTDHAEVDAVVKLIDTLPDVADKMQADILPILDTLGTVAPDLRDLLDVSRELNEILSGVPGLGRIKRRIEQRQESQDGYRAAEKPPPAPDRRS